MNQLRPYCQACGWRKGGPDSWNGAACKCGHTEPPIRTEGDQGIVNGLGTVDNAGKKL